MARNLQGACQILPTSIELLGDAGRLFGELDYVQEGRNAERFNVSCLTNLSSKMVC